MSLVEPHAAVHLPPTACTVPGAGPEYCQQRHLPFTEPHSDIAVFERRQLPRRPQHSELARARPLARVRLAGLGGLGGVARTGRVAVEEGLTGAVRVR